MDVIELAGHLRSSLTSALGTGDGLRLIRQFISDVERSPTPGDLLGLRPPSCGDRRWDALVAGVVEDLAFRLGIPVPAWTADDSYLLSEWWFVTSIPDMRPTAFVETPAAIANRGVYIRRSSLVNV